MTKSALHEAIALFMKQADIERQKPTGFHPDRPAPMFLPDFAYDRLADMVGADKINDLAVQALRHAADLGQYVGPVYQYVKVYRMSKLESVDHRPHTTPTGRA